MGNTSSAAHDSKRKSRKWSKKGYLQFHKRSFFKVLCLDSCKIDDDNVLVASMCQGGTVIVSKLYIQNKKKIGSTKIAELKMQIGDHIVTDLSTVKLSQISGQNAFNIACAGTDNFCRIFTIDLDPNQQATRNTNDECVILDAQNKAVGCITDIKFICDGRILTSYADGSLLLWNFADKKEILSIKINIECAIDDILSIDHINLNRKNIVAFVGGENGQKIYFKDLTQLIQANGHKYPLVIGSIDWIDYGLHANIEYVSFSKNGDFLAAIADNGCYCIYSVNVSNLSHIHCSFVCKKMLNQMKGHILLTWADPQTVLVTDSTHSTIYATQITTFKCDAKVKNSIKKGVVDISEQIAGDISERNINYICGVIELYLQEFDILEYDFESKIESRILSFAACTFGHNDQHSIVFAGTANKDVRCIL